MHFWQMPTTVHHIIVWQCSAHSSGGGGGEVVVVCSWQRKINLRLSQE